jgi:hypothetical protein
VQSNLLVVLSLGEVVTQTDKIAKPIVQLFECRGTILHLISALIKLELSKSSK